MPPLSKIHTISQLDYKTKIYLRVGQRWRLFKLVAGCCSYIKKCTRWHKACVFSMSAQPWQQGGRYQWKEKGGNTEQSAQSLMGTLHLPMDETVTDYFMLYNTYFDKIRLISRNQRTTLVMVAKNEELTGYLYQVTTSKLFNSSSQTS